MDEPKISNADSLFEKPLRLSQKGPPPPPPPTLSPSFGHFGTPRGGWGVRLGGFCSGLACRGGGGLVLTFSGVFYVPKGTFYDPFGCGPNAAGT